MTRSFLNIRVIKILSKPDSKSIIAYKLLILYPNTDLLWKVLCFCNNWWSVILVVLSVVTEFTHMMLVQLVAQQTHSNIFFCCVGVGLVVVMTSYIVPTSCFFLDNFLSYDLIKFHRVYRWFHCWWWLGGFF